ncbi:hypothetical protein KOR42_23650 [Thalassoglobus neptunius]|uniref:Uncharacterized protein n=1 Tax=Thalassoglobus neptunius TaxID=1938619 RepID=A0A5C5X825_9PLAN|nr:hypothetical protein [Thalassoglobus neptunius]TWT58978.1 hypothetical protein KOR42_23650 [Thalassoglobus neptunius]
MLFSLMLAILFSWVLAIVAFRKSRELGSMKANRDHWKWMAAERANDLERVNSICGLANKSLDELRSKEKEQEKCIVNLKGRISGLVDQVSEKEQLVRRLQRQHSESEKKIKLCSEREQAGIDADTISRNFAKVIFECQQKAIRLLNDIGRGKRLCEFCQSATHEPGKSAMCESCDTALIESNTKLEQANKEELVEIDYVEIRKDVTES